MNRTVMIGRIVNDLEIAVTPNGTTYLKFRVAVDANFQKKGEERKTNFFNATAWRGTAEFISKYFAKGRMILLEGEFQSNQYTDKNGNPATWYDLAVENAYFTGEKANDNAPSQASAAEQASNGSTAGSASSKQSSYSASEQPSYRGEADDDYPF